jgi:hypothetical protein
MASILSGIGELVDGQVLAAIAAANPQPFSYGLAASRHLQPADLAAVIGTNGADCVTWPDGSFRTSTGVKAALSASNPGSFVGAFQRAFVVIWPDVSIHSTRLNVMGDMTISVFVNLTVALPDAASFWSAA